ncbi:tetratricopeptide repeat protein [Lacibacter sediminis]|uniref:Tetratricopeptide repeat protein n=1 Tax=Lacibacter sediminis TaxID=2760713 RepID=A0A7G5XHU5_9BACT|nr:tetratricopeptide repeat protein [Lacibacter sediminis]QNA45048.1 tetratricopeptide repeat protein [Lacibacter sediminis]
MYKSFIILCCTVLLAACSKNSKPVVQEEKIMVLLQQNKSANSVATIAADMKFWSDRLAITADDMSSQIKLASLYNQRFQYSGQISDIHKSDSLYHVANQLQKKFSSGIYRSLASNCVTQHQFIQADRYLDTAATMGDDLYLTRLQQFDVKLELGDYRQAEAILNAFRHKNNFDYYTRASKLEDHKGNSEASISFMEKAYADIKESKKDQLLPWVKTNLADMYGHNNRISESYKLYTEVVNDHPDYYHAWKGIAWIAYSNDKNTTFAKKILTWLQEQHPVPDYDLMLSEIAAFEQNNQARNQYLASFIDKVSDPVYGDMYNKYLFTIMSDELNNQSTAMAIAKKEISNRPTPQSYELFAWSLYKSGQVEEAVKIAESRIINKTFEPDALYHIGMLLKKSGQPKLAKQYLTEALESSFELGPVTANEIKEELKTL